MRLWMWFPIMLLSMLLVSEAYADLDPFEFQIYPYQTGGKGKIDPQFLGSFVPSGFREPGRGTSSDSTFASQYMTRMAAEFEYGLTRKIDFAYLCELGHSRVSSHGSSICRLEVSAPRPVF